VLTHGNFLVRSRGLFLARGFAVAVVDAPSDQSAGLGSFRFSPDHVLDIAAVVDWLRKSAPAPVWLVGTSRGTLSAANAAGRVSGVAGLVLTSTVTRARKRQPGTVFDTGLAGLRLPVLVVHHRDDGCVVCPSSDTGEIMRQLGKAAKAELILVEGGDPPRSEPCEALSAHGYFGIEAKVVTAIADWIRAN
jgi:pimeloyl-ACP methyl ester carboxylesterase